MEGPPPMFHVYCIESLSRPGRYYVGFTENLEQRIASHNNGCNPSTVAARPWKLRGYVAFDHKAAAVESERHLKTGYGHAFRKQRLW